MPALGPSGSLFAGLISGTSMDGVDAALVRFDDHACETLSSITVPYSDELRDKLLFASRRPSAVGVDELAELDHAVGIGFRDAANTLLDTAGVAAAEVSAIGSHGQTLRHRPTGKHPFSVQIGDPNLIAQGTRITTVADFRRRDVAAGGEGAPLTPAFHHWLFARSDRIRCVLNLGGIANLSVLSPDRESVIGLDTGPANTLLDAWILEQRGMPYDDGGKWAKSGRPNDALLARFLADGYFSRPAPKSTGFEYFNLSWLSDKLGGKTLPPADVQATLLELTTASVANDLRRFAPQCDELLLCGGGVHNDELTRRLTAAVRPVPVVSTAAYGLDPGCVEAAAFAWLAKRTLSAKPGNLPNVTGAASPEVLGGVYPCWRAG